MKRQREPDARPGGFAMPRPPPAANGSTDALAAPPEDLACPCCFRPGRLCESFAPEEAQMKLEGLRVLMVSHGLDAYVVPSGDAHSSEYVAACDERRAWLTGFTGSAGTALVARKAALLWTDGRYFNQAATQLAGSPWTLMRTHEPGVPDLPTWLLENCAAGARVGVDAALAPLGFAADFAAKTAGALELAPVTSANFVDLLWGRRRPAVPRDPIYAQPLARTGETVASKIARVAAALGDAKALCLNALDQICWLTNLRGSDIACNPVFFAYAVLSLRDGVALTLYLRRLDGDAGDADALRRHFEEAEGCGGADGPRVILRPYAAFGPEACLADCGEAGAVVLERSSATLAMAAALDPSRLRRVAASPVETFKASKNAVEIAGLRSAGARDCAALAGFFAWLEDRLDRGAPVNEAEAADEISRRRAAFAGELYKGDSFPTISSAGANASVIHYQPSRESCAPVAKDAVYLCDTGAQYADGTTDITRTTHHGKPTAEERRCYTRVLQGHVALASAVFPEGTPGLMLDALARGPLWKDGLNYLHGTGHGMGSLLNVHEGPFGVGGGAVGADKGLASANARQKYLHEIREGYYVSDEPGFYKDGAFGFRIESDLVSVAADTKFGYGARKWLKFDYLTPLPMARALIEDALLSPDEIAWIDDFHANTCWAQLAPMLKGAPDEARTRDWLWRACRPLGEAACPDVPH